MEIYVETWDFRDLLAAIVFNFYDWYEQILKKYGVSPKDIVKVKLKQKYVEMLRKDGEKIFIYPK